MMMRLAAYDYDALPAPPSSMELADYWRPYIEPCIELFGPERCMVESNFPVEKMGNGYAALWNALSGSQQARHRWKRQRSSVAPHCVCFDCHRQCNAMH
jgi:hypothetical protein